MIITQNLYAPSKFGVTIRRNFNYYCLFSSFGDSSCITQLGRTFFGGRVLQEAFSLMSNNKEKWNSYILLDDHPNTPFPENCRLRSNIFDMDFPEFFIN